MPKPTKKEQQEIEDLAKTAVVIGGANLLLTPVYAENKSYGFLLSLLVTAGLLFKFHEDGKKKRPVENAINKGVVFFNKDQGAQIENKFTNIITGGATHFNAAEDLVKKSVSKCNCSGHPSF